MWSFFSLNTYPKDCEMNILHDVLFYSCVEIVWTITGSCSTFTDQRFIFSCNSQNPIGGHYFKNFPHTGASQNIHTKKPAFTQTQMLRDSDELARLSTPLNSLRDIRYIPRAVARFTFICFQKFMNSWQVSR